MFVIGGGAVLVPVFYQMLGVLEVDEAIRMHLSVGTSLAIIVPTSIRSFMGHKAKGAVDMALLKAFTISVPVGVLLATLLVAGLSSGVFHDAIWSTNSSSGCDFSRRWRFDLYSWYDWLYLGRLGCAKSAAIFNWIRKHLDGAYHHSHHTFGSTYRGKACTRAK